MATTTEILDAVTSLTVEFREFKEVCHTKQAKCRGEIHGRINKTGERVAEIEGRHKAENGVAHRRQDDPEPHRHKRTAGTIRGYPIDKAVLVILSLVAGERAFHWLYKILAAFPHQ